MLQAVIPSTYVSCSYEELIEFVKTFETSNDWYILEVIKLTYAERLLDTIGKSAEELHALNENMRQTINIISRTITTAENIRTQRRRTVQQLEAYEVLIGFALARKRRKSVGEKRSC